MTPKLLILLVLTILPLTLWSASGEELAKECNECHGEAGHSTDPKVPSIGGFSGFAISDLLETYRSGMREARPWKRKDGTETNMNEIARNISAEDLEAIGRYYEQQKWQPQNESFDEELANRGAQIHDLKCDKCHSNRGTVADDDLSILAGQWREYLQQQFEDFDSGARPLAEKMAEKYETLSADDKRALLELFVRGG